MLSDENRVVQSMWIPGHFSNNELLGMYSYLANGHEFHLYTYTKKIKNVPEGVIIKDANEIVPYAAIFKDTFNSTTAFADWFRFKLLYERGGWWVDLDTACLQSLEMRQKYCFSSEMDSNGNFLINPTCIKTPRQSPFLKECLDFIGKRGKRNVSFGEFGLSLYRRILVRYECLDFIKGPEVFCPIHWFELYRLISKSDHVFSSDTFTIHLWNDMWRRGRLSKNAIYHPESIYERLKRKFLPGYNGSFE